MLLHPLNSHLLILPPFELPPLEGWGGTDQVTEIGGRWNFKENKCHINSLELQAAFFYLKAFCKNKTRLHILLKQDNTTAVAYINKIGGTISASCNKLAKDIWNWAKGQDIGSLHPMYLGLNILLLISGHIFFMITKSGL